MLDLAERRGRNAAMRGAPYGANPYTFGTHSYLAWSRGHNLGRIQALEAPA